MSNQLVKGAAMLNSSFDLINQALTDYVLKYLKAAGALVGMLVGGFWHEHHEDSAHHHLHWALYAGSMKSAEDKHAVRAEQHHAHTRLSHETAAPHAETVADKLFRLAQESETDHRHHDASETHPTELTPQARLGLTIGILRKHQHLTKAELAKRMHTAVDEIWKIELGAMPLNRLQKHLAALDCAFDLPVDHLSHLLGVYILEAALDDVHGSEYEEKTLAHYVKIQKD